MNISINPKYELNIQWPEASNWMLLTIFLLAAISSCSEDEKNLATITFINPVEEDLFNSSWAVGDSMIIVFQAEVTSGRMLPVQMGIGRYSNNNQAVRTPEEILLSDTFRTNEQEAIFTARWKLPGTTTPSGEGIYYRLLISSNPERQPIDESPPLMIPIQIKAENP